MDTFSSLVAPVDVPKEGEGKMKSLLLLFWTAFAVASCDSNLAVHTSEAPASLADGKKIEGESESPLPKTAKFNTVDCVDPRLSEVPTTVTLTLCNGELAQGQLDLSGVVPENIKAGMIIAGVTGAALLESHSDCSADGAAQCVVDGTAYRAAAMTNVLANNIKSGVTIAGVSGSASVELHGNCSSDGETGCVATAAYAAADMSQVTAGNIRNGVTIAGRAGTYPSASTPLANATPTTDLTSLAATTAVGTYEFFDSTGARHTGAIADAGTITPSGVDQVFNSSLYREFTVSGDSDLNVANIKSGVDIFGVMGTLTGAPSNCSANGVVGCVTTATFKAADLSNLTAANIKKNVVVAGVTGDYPSTTHPLAGANAGVTDLPDFASTTGNATYEWFQSDGTRLTDTIQANETVSPSNANQTLNGGLYRSVTVEGDADLVATNIKTAVNIFGVTGNVVPDAAPLCTTDGDVGCITTALFKSADMASVLNSNIRNGIVIAGVTGNYGGAYANCSANGEVGCVTDSTYKAADLSNLLAANVKNGVTIAGVAGTYPSLATPLAGATGTSDLTSMAANAPAGNYEFFDSTGTRYTGSISDAGTVTPGTSNQTFSTSLYRGFTVAGDADLVAANITAGTQIFGVTGTTTPTPADCNADNQTGCVTTATYKSADTGAFIASDLKSGKTVAGVAGSLANCLADGAQGCVTTPTYKSANMTNVTAANIKSGVTIAGQLGDYPSATNRLAGADGTTDLPTFASTTGGTTYEWFQSDGTRLTAAVQANQTVTPSASNQTLNSGLYRSVTVNGDVDLVAGKIKSGVNLFGVAGDYPSAANPLTGSDSTADLTLENFDAQVKSATAFEWFDQTGTRYTYNGDPDITAANISNGVTIFGTTGTLVSSPCTGDGQQNCVTTSRYKSADTNAYSTWDIRKGKTVGGKAGDIAFYKNMKGTYDNTTSPAISGTDVWDTIDDYNANGAFPTTAPSGWDQATGANWIMDPANDTVTVNGLCDGAEACVFIDRITGLMWTKEQGTGSTLYSWQDAITQCDNLNYGGYTDWRLPTQKEMMQAYTDGIWSQKATDKLSLTSNAYWSSSTGSYDTSYAWGVDLLDGSTDYKGKSISTRVVCVR